MALTLSAGGASGNSLTDRDGWEFISRCSWTNQYVSHVYFNLDKKKYEHFVLNMYTDGKGYGSTDWSGAYFEFMTGPNTADELGGVASTDWGNASSYMGANFTAPVYSNNAGNTGSYAWMAAGDGNSWLGHSMALISVPDTALNWGSIRCMGGLSTNDAIASTYSYVEDSGGVCRTKYGKEITGIRIFGSGTGPSRTGSITLHGIKK